VVQTGFGKIVLIPSLPQIGIQQSHGFRLVIKGTQVHDLDTQPFVYREELSGGTIQFFLFGGGFLTLSFGDRERI
jgi:hypothetical protein